MCVCVCISWIFHENLSVGVNMQTFTSLMLAFLLQSHPVCFETLILHKNSAIILLLFQCTFTFVFIYGVSCVLFLFVVQPQIWIRILCEYQSHCHKCHQRQVFIFPIIGHMKNTSVSFAKGTMHCIFNQTSRYRIEWHAHFARNEISFFFQVFFSLHILLHLSYIVINLTILYVT